MIPEKRIIRRDSSLAVVLSIARIAASASFASVHTQRHELDQLDIIERKKPIQKGQTLFKAGDELKSLYAIRSVRLKVIPSLSKATSKSLVSIW